MKRRSLGLALIASCMFFAGCEQKSSGPVPAGSGAPVAALPSSASGHDGGAASAGSDAGGAKATASAAGAWTGTYTSKQAGEPAPRKTDDDGTQGVGDGAITLSVGEDRIATGTLDGALGESVLSGQSSGDTMSGTLFPKQASPTSFYGTWVLERKDGALKGKIVASRGNAGAVREADLTLKGK
jgi:hypothetical protein